MTPTLSHPDPTDLFDEAIANDVDLLTQAAETAFENDDLEEGEW